MPEFRGKKGSESTIELDGYLGVELSVAVGLFGLVPLLAYVAVELMPFLRVNTFMVASFSTGATLFLLGALKVQVTGRSWVRSGAEMLVVGGIAATAAYWIGVLLGGLA